ncbi:hypothetical protein Syun_003635 [Stephania yunnanensis]|uniref:Uncharacterized protein n=1 Tax=Stephania yunnanensis TaxID=152371 RepID=A0AAP0L1J1_9MAGN
MRRRGRHGGDEAVRRRGSEWQGQRRERETEAARRRGNEGRKRTRREGYMRTLTWRPVLRYDLGQNLSVDIEAITYGLVPLLLLLRPRIGRGVPEAAGLDDVAHVDWGSSWLRFGSTPHGVWWNNYCSVLGARVGCRARRRLLLTSTVDELGEWGCDTRTGAGTSPIME